ncbi:MAG: 2,3,4,5-tetrahydropyridine-2,6-dicarboxylate N-succinyltransferase, partial [Candidatus Sedimenticola sp. (ex Thyasira tokunagai)]
MSDIQAIIEEAYEQRAEITPRSVDTVVKDAVLATIEMLDRGEIRAAEKKGDEWVVNDWVKKAVMLKFRIQDNQFC